MDQLTPKERMMLQDQLRHEQVCATKYRSYAGRASPAVKAMFNEFAQDEQDHYDTLNRLLEGQASARQGTDPRDRYHDVDSELAATSGGHFVPVDTFGRQAGQGSEQAGLRAWNWQGAYGPGRTNHSLDLGNSGPGAWQSTASQILYERQFGNTPPQLSRRSHQWGGLLPGDVPDPNHGDLTRGGLDQRGVNLSGISRAPQATSAQVPEGFPPPSPGPHVMASHIVTDNGQAARVWGSHDEGTSRVGSLRTGGWMSDTRFIYGGQEPSKVQCRVPSGDFQRWVSGEQTETQRALDRTIRADEERLAGRRDITGSEPATCDEQSRFQGKLGWAHLDARRQPHVPDSSDLYGTFGPTSAGTGSAQWYGPSTDQSRYGGSWSTSLVRPTGPVSLPSTRMEAAEEWDGADLSPWSDMTSPVPLDTDNDTWPQIGSANAGHVTASADDQTMLTDMLMTERFVSGAYDSAVFDSANPQVRQALHQIQRDEQEHGERIRNQLSRQSSQA